MAKYTYRFIDVIDKQTGPMQEALDAQIAVLNHYGAQGWAVVFVQAHIHDEHANPIVRYLLRRKR